MRQFDFGVTGSILKFSYRSSINVKHVFHKSMSSFHLNNIFVHKNSLKLVIFFCLFNFSLAHLSIKYDKNCYTFFLNFDSHSKNIILLKYSKEY